MSDYQQKELSGSLFKNSKKEKDTHPDVRGTAKIDGVDYRVSGWNRTTKGGAPWISLAFTRADEAPQRQQPQSLMQEQASERPVASPERRAAEGAIAGMPDDIPFINLARGISGHAF